MTIRNTVKESRLREFWYSNEPVRVLATEWGVSVAAVCQLAKRIGLPSPRWFIKGIRQEIDDQRFRCSGGSSRYFESEAARRNVTPATLKRLLIDIISNDRLIDAILDDVGEIDSSKADVSNRILKSQ